MNSEFKKLIIVFFTGLVLLSQQGCFPSFDSVASVSPIDGPSPQPAPPSQPPNSGGNSPPNDPVITKSLPKGVFVSEGAAKIVNATTLEAGNLVSPPPSEEKKCIMRNNVEVCAKDGVLVSIPWDLFENQTAPVNIEQYDIILTKLRDYIDVQLDNAEDPRNALQISLVISDGDNAPEYVKQRCAASLGLFSFDFTNPNVGTVASSMCFPWDPAYLEEKKKLVDMLGQNFDNRAGLAYVYFTGPCSTNGNEGHCRISKTDYASAGNDPNMRYTESRMNNAYIEIMNYYFDAFPTTPITMEAHAMFRSTNTADLSAHVFEAVWQQFRQTKRLGISAWWCAERLSVDDAETYLVWDILQEAAKESFTVCQPVGKVTGEPYRFTASNKINYFTGNTFSIDFGLYQTEFLGYSQADYNLYYNTTTKTVINAAKKNAAEKNVFDDFINWIKGRSHKAGQTENIQPFSVMEPWTADFNNTAFTESLIDNF